MQCLQTAILHHQTLKDSHHDWLWVDPNNPDQLTGFRMLLSAYHWRTSQTWLLTPLPPHRLIYLHYQGAISGNRGTVVQIAQGTVTPLLWATDLWHLSVHLPSVHPEPIHIMGQCLPGKQHWRAMIQE